MLTIYIPGGGGGSTSLAGDVTGTTAASTVAKIQGQPVSATAVTKGQFLVGTAASSYGPASISGDIAASAVTAGSLTVTGLTGSAGVVSAAATALTFAAAATIATAAGALTVDSFAALNLGTSTATSVSVGKSATTTTINGPLSLANASVTWPVAVSSPSISQSQQTSDAACSSITITPQAPFASAITNLVGGSLNVALSAPISGTTEAAFSVSRAGTRFCQIQTYPGLSNYGAIYLVPGISIAANSETLAASSSTVILNHGSQVVLGISGATIFACNSTSTISAVPIFSWTAGVTAPSIIQTAPAAVSSGNGTAATTFAFGGQSGGATSANSATGGAATTTTISSGGGGNATGTTATGGAAGNLVLNAAAGGTGTSTAGANGSVQVAIASTVLASWTPGGPTETVYAWSMGITTGTATLTSAQYFYGAISVATVSLSGALTIVFPSTVGGVWLLDLSKVTFGAFAITVKCGTGAAATTISSTSAKFLWTVQCTVANTCVIG